MSVNEKERYIKFETFALGFIKENIDNIEDNLSILTNVLIKAYIAYYGHENSEYLIEQVQNCFDHYQEIANIKGIDKI